jgi:hypothetical protein
MAKQVFDNSYLTAYIYGFGDVGHREHLREIEFETTLKEEIELYRTGPHFRSHYAYFYYFLEHEFNKEGRNHMAKKLLRCHCCSRHSHYKVNRPPPNPLPESKKKECDCNCRHIYRYFKRDNLIDIPSILNEHI